MKIIQVVSMYPPSLGGMENAVRYISESLSKEGHKVEVYTSDIGCENGRLKSTINLKIHYLKSIKFAHTPIIFSLFLRLLFIPKKSIIHLHIAQAFTPEIVYIISKIKGIPYIAHIHLDIDKSGKLGFLLKPYKKYLLNYVLKNAKKVICLTEDQKILIAKKYNLTLKNIIVIPNGVGSEFFIKHKNLENKVTNLLFVGRLDSQKNIPLLVNAISLLKHDVILDIVGEGEKRKEIQDLVNQKKLKNIHLHGRKTGEELIDFYRKADIFVITSHKEGVSLSMLEAMAAGLPIVGTDVPGIRDLIKDVGILVPSNISNKLAEVLDYLIANKKLQEEISEKSVVKVKEYRWEKVVERIEKIYKETIN